MFFWIFFWLMILLAVGTTPVWPHSRRYGYYPTGGFTLLLVFFMCLWMFGGLGSFGRTGWWGY
jgi:hypothetical protein